MRTSCKARREWRCQDNLQTQMNELGKQFKLLVFEIQILKNSSVNDMHVGCTLKSVQSWSFI